MKPNIVGLTTREYSSKVLATTFWMNPAPLSMVSGLRTRTTAVIPGSIGKSDDGVWRAELLTATDPLGRWPAPIAVYAPLSANATEWDFVEVSSTSWIGGGG